MEIFGLNYNEICFLNIYINVDQNKGHHYYYILLFNFYTCLIMLNETRLWKRSVLSFNKYDPRDMKKVWIKSFIDFITI
jgi:hypothetical protein